MNASFALVAVALSLAAAAPAHAQEGMVHGVTVSEPHVEDASGAPLGRASVGEAVVVSSGIGAWDKEVQPYVYIVRIDDARGITHSLTETSGSVEDGGWNVVEARWIPREAGEYEATVLVWESVDSPVALAPSHVVRISVEGGGAPVPAAPAARVSVEIPAGTGIAGCDRSDECYLPATVEVAPGTTVAWMNTDAAPHTVTAGTRDGGSTGEFDSGLILRGEEFAREFTEPGEHPYWCVVHPWMEGTVIVTGAAAPAAPAPPAPAPPEPAPPAAAPATVPAPPAPAPPEPAPAAAAPAAPAPPAPEAAPEPAPPAATVEIPEGADARTCAESGTCWLPAEIEVAVGTTVTWVNSDSAGHTVTAGTPAGGISGVFDSDLVDAGGSFSHTFGEPGEYPYYCLIHPWRVGTVAVR